MSFANPENVSIEHSAFYDIQGNYYGNGILAPGERGIRELFNASCPDAYHDSRARYPPPRCLDGTRVDVLKEISNWLARVDEKVLWVFGPAGAGKSAIAQTVAEACADSSTLGGAFFFFRGAPGRDTVDNFVTTITSQLITKIPEKRVEIGELIERDPSILHKPLEIQIKSLIVPLFKSKFHGSPNTVSPHHTPLIIIVDGLDECQGDNNQRDVVEAIGELVDMQYIPLRFIIVSRPEPQIEEPFNHLRCVIHRTSLSSPRYISQAENDIHMYLRHNFNKIYQRRYLEMEEYWPSDNIVKKLVQKSGGMFIYASTVIKYVNDPDFHPVERLNEILHNSPGSTPFVELDHLYQCILRAYKNTELLLRALMIICCCSTTHLTLLGLAGCEKLLQLRTGGLTIVLRRMRSIFDVTKMIFYHKSFTDFIHERKRAEQYFIDNKRGNAFVAQQLLRSIRPDVKHDFLFGLATSEWFSYCKLSGHWDESPHLLKEISTTLDSYKHLEKCYLTWPVLYNKSTGKSNISLDDLKWFQIDKVEPKHGNKYHPHNVRDRLIEELRKVESVTVNQPQDTVSIVKPPKESRNMYSRTNNLQLP